MAWTQPKTWSSEPLTSLDLNTFMRDNQNHLKDRMDNSSSRIISGANDYSTTSTAWVDIDSQNLSLALETHGGDVLLGYTGSVRINKDSKWAFFNIAVDGTDHFADNGLTMLSNSGSQDANRPKPLSIVVLIPNLSAGNHNFKLRWKTNPGSTLSMDIVTAHPQFWAKEI